MESKATCLGQSRLLKAIELNPLNDRVYGGLAAICGQMGNYAVLEEYWRKAEGIRDKFYNPITANNYLRLKQILDKRKIRLVCAQYPVRGIKPLKNRVAGAEFNDVTINKEMC